MNKSNILIFFVAFLLLSTSVISFPNITTAVTFSNNGKLAASGDEGSTVNIFDLKNKTILNTFSDDSYDDTIFTIKFSSDDKYLITGSKTGLKVWDFRKGLLIRAMPTQNIIAIDIHNDFVLTGNWTGELQFWNIKSGNLIWSKKRPYPNINSIKIFKNGNYAITAGDDAEVVLWDIKKGEPIRSLLRTKFLFKALDLSEDNKTFSADGPNDTIIINSIDTVHSNFIITDENQTINVIKFHPNKKTHLFAAGTLGKISIYNFTTGDKIAELRGHDDIVTDLEISPDGKNAITASWDTTVRIWSLEKNQLSHTFGNSTHIPGPPSAITDFANYFGTILSVLLFLICTFFFFLGFSLKKIFKWISNK